MWRSFLIYNNSVSGSTVQANLTTALDFVLPCETMLGHPVNLRFNLAGDDRRTVKLPHLPEGHIEFKTQNNQVAFVATNNKSQVDAKSARHHYGVFGLAGSQNDWLLELQNYRFFIGQINTSFPYRAPLMSRGFLMFDAGVTCSGFTDNVRIKLDPTLPAIYSSYAWWHRVVDPLRAQKMIVEHAATVICGIYGIWSDMAMNLTGGPGVGPQGKGILLLAPGEYATMGADGCFRLPWVPTTEDDGITLGRPFFGTRKVAVVHCDAPYGCVEVSDDALLNFDFWQRVMTVPLIIFATMGFFCVVAMCFRDPTKDAPDSPLSRPLLRDDTWGSHSGVSIVGRMEVDGKPAGFLIASESSGRDLCSSAISHVSGIGCRKMQSSESAQILQSLTRLTNFSWTSLISNLSDLKQGAFATYGGVIDPSPSSADAI